MTAGTETGWLARLAPHEACREALLFAGISIDYPTLRASSVAITHRLRALGVEAGDLVALLAPPSSSGVALIHAMLDLLATETVRYPDNLIHIVWDNRMYLLTGKQPSATAFQTDLATMAEGCGFEKVARCESLQAFKAAVDKALAEPGPHFIHALNDDKDPVGHFPRSPTFIRHRFMHALGVAD